MMTLQPFTQPSASDSGRPAKWTLVRWAALVLAVHLALLMGIAGTVDWRLQSPQVVRTGPMQTRWVPPTTSPGTVSAPAPTKTAAPTTRVAQVTKTAPPTTTPTPTPESSPSAELTPAADTTESSWKPSPASATDPAQAASAPQTQLTEAVPPLTESSAPVTASAEAPTPPNSVSHPPERIAAATMDLPNIALAALPPSAALSYRLNGQEKGLNYQASGELRWQHNDSAYAMSLSVKAFLVGSRSWRSQGQITSAGLAPTKFSDSWRSERAAHFDHVQNRIVFSSNAPTAPLQAGAQDQISLYVQLAAAMAGSGGHLKQGTRLQIQTATIRDALPWLLTLDQIETLTMEGQTLQATKWVCQPRNRFDAKVEFWVAAEHHWLPVRIRITQVSGSFIDLNLKGRETLAPLPPTNLPS